MDPPYNFLDSFDPGGMFNDLTPNQMQQIHNAINFGSTDFMNANSHFSPQGASVIQNSSGTNGALPSFWDITQGGSSMGCDPFSSFPSKIDNNLLHSAGGVGYVHGDHRDYLSAGFNNAYGFSNRCSVGPGSSQSMLSNPRP